MSIRVEVNKKQESKNNFNYPCILICKEWDLIILFTAESKGTVLKPDSWNEHHIGEYSDDWDMDGFEELKGNMTLSNN